MRALAWCGIPIALAAALVTGCERVPDSNTDAQPPATPQFSARKGLLLPEQTRMSLGLEVVEVTERKMAASLALPLRVYQVESDALRASGMVTPEQAKSLKPGQAIQVRAAHGTCYNGKVAGLMDQLEKATGLVEVLVEIPDRSDGLTIGASLAGKITFAVEPRVLTIPRPALLTCSEGSFVYTVSGEHLVRTAVKLGARDDDFVEITDGLYAGDQVVAQPVLSLWMTELAAVKGGQACCLEPPRGK